MIIVGAGGHAKEVLGILAEAAARLAAPASAGSSDLFFYDDVSPAAPAKLFGRYPVLRTPEEARSVLTKDPQYILGVGDPSVRRAMEKQFTGWGGRLTSAISPHARIGAFGVNLGEGLNIMTGAVLTQDLAIGKGTLIHIHVSVHHDCRIGEFCELSPGARILGKAGIGDLSSIGAGAIILPGIRVGNGVRVGAGAVVTRDVADGLTVKGIPAR